MKIESEIASGHGLFLALEGIDGAGKSTQASLLTQQLEALGLSVEVLHEPGDTVLGEHLRELLKHDEQAAPTHDAELLLFAAARSQLVSQRIKPLLNAGTIVICDRYIGSTLAYQGFGRGLALERIVAVNQIATNGLVPNLTILLNITVNAGLSRKAKRQVEASGGLQIAFDSVAADHSFDRFEDEAVAFQHRIREGYLAVAMASLEKYSAGQWVTIDGMKPIHAVAESIWNVVAPLVAKS